MVPETWGMFIHFSSSPSLGLLILSSFSVQQQLNCGQKWGAIYVGLSVLNGKVLWASLFSSGAAKSIMYHNVQFTEVDCFDILQKVYFLSLISFLWKACLALGIFHIFSMELYSSMMRDQGINISVYSWAKYCKLSIKLYQYLF